MAAKIKKRKKTVKNKKYSVKGQQVFAVLMILVSLILFIALVSQGAIDDRRISGEIDGSLDPFDLQFRNQAGMLGAYLAFICSLIMGWLAYFIPIALIAFSIRLFAAETSKKMRFSVTLLFATSLLTTMIYNIHILTNRTLVANDDITGGFIGEKLTLISTKLFGELGSYVILSGTIILFLIIYTSLSGLLKTGIPIPGKSLFELGAKKFISLFSFSWLSSLFSWKKEDEDGEDNNDRFENELKEQLEADSYSEPDYYDEPVEQKDSVASKKTKSTQKVTITKKPAKIQVESMNYEYPVLDHLENNPQPGPVVSEEELKFTSRMLKETLETFGVKIDGVIERYPGPIITRYEFKPGTGIKVNQIINLSDDLALALKAKRIRIIAPIPGKAAVGIEIPNRKAQIVYLKDVLESEEYTKKERYLPLALGKTTSGKPFVTDLAKLPHLLIAGATGSGKSVCMNILVTSLLYRLHPHQVRFIMIDPKMLELTVYSGIPHLGRPVVTNPRRAEKVLSDAVVEMEGRYRKLANASVRNIEAFNKKQDKLEDHLPYIVIMVDELADLLMSGNSSKTELLITRLAQMARAVGIHLILATQRPSVDVITGLIKANFPARIAFQVSQKVDSRTIIDGNGAEKLLGAGDMLFLQPGQPEPTRLHGALLTSEETEAIVKQINDQNLPMLALENISQAVGETTKKEIDFGDPLFKEACDVCIRHKQGSVSLLQRRLGIGYQRAARLIDKLEQAGIVSPFDGSKARELLVDKAYIDTLFNNAASTEMVDQNSN